MTWMRKIKVLYMLSFSVLFYASWSIIAGILLYEKPSFLLFALLILTCIITQIFFSHDQYGKIPLAVTIAVSAVLCFLIGIKYFIFNEAAVIFYILCLNKLERQDLLYEEARNKVRKNIIFMVLLGIFLFIYKFDIQYIIRMYFLFLILSIISLREIRAYQFGIARKNYLITNIGITISIVVLSVNVIFGTIAKAFSVVFKFVLDILSYVAFYLGCAIGYILMPLTNLFIKSPKNKKDYVDYVGNVGKTPDFSKYKGGSITVSPVALYIIEAAIVVIILFVLYKFFRTGNRNKKILKDDEIEIREDIKSVHKHGRKKADDLAEFLKARTIKDKIFYYFKKYEQKTFDKGIFKTFMTAGQLKNIVRANTDAEADSLENITDLYNEAKFSSHDMKDNDIKTIKISFKDVKNKI